MPKKTYDEYKDILIYGLLAVIVGIIVGAIDTLFGKVLITLTTIRESNILILLPFLPIVGMIITVSYLKYGKNSNKGMGLIFSAGFNEEEVIPKRLVPFIMISTWLTHLFGGSAGREGVAVQIGGTVAHTIGRKINIKDSKSVMLITGMAAGFSGLFQTPIAAVFFALELLISGFLEYKALLPAIIGAYTASYTSHYLGLEKFSVDLNEIMEFTQNFSVYFILKLVVIGIIFGITGGLFAHLLNVVKTYFNNKIQNPILKILILGCILSIFLLILHKGRYSGLGTNIIEASFSGQTVYYYDWIMKFLFTILTLSAGFQGGEVTPLFTIGSSLGVVLASLLGLPTPLIAALGYAAVFGSATNTLIAPIFIGAEVFGYDYLPYFFIVTVIAYVFNGNKSIYSGQKLLSYEIKNDL